MYRLEPLQNPTGSYPNNRTTIPKSKATAGPSNTSDSKTVTDSNSQIELVVANAEIERLQELLKARETPIPSDKLSDTQRLATVLKALA